MNLIGHLACAERLTPDAQLGAILPDLLSLYDRGVRPFKLLRGGGGRVEAGEVRDGVRFHYHVDSHFHRSPLFRDGSRALRERLMAAGGAPGLKRFAVAHVLIELFLDHLLIVRDGARLAAFYGALERRDGGALEALLAGLPELDWAGFSGFIGRLAALRFADGYLDRPGLLDRTDRILGRLGQRRLERRERDALLETMAGHAGFAQRQLDAFLLDMQAWQPRAAEAARAAPDDLASDGLASDGLASDGAASDGAARDSTPGVDSGGPAGLE